jgi:uncharacterized protein (TIRG00374 family)
VKRWQTLVIGVIVSGLAMAYALNGVPFETLGEQFTRGQYSWVIPCIFLSILGLFFRAVRWKSLLNHKMGLDHSFNIINAGYFLNALLPLRLGEVARIYLTTQLTPPIPVFTALSTIVAERLIDTVTVGIMLLMALAITPNIPGSVQGAALVSAIIALIGLGVLIFFAAQRKLALSIVRWFTARLPFLAKIQPEALAERVLDGLAPLASVRGAVETIGWTAVSWFFSVFAAYVLMPMFYPRMDWAAALLMVSLASLAIALPAVPGSVGPFELAVITALGATGFVPDGDAEAKARALAFAVILHVVNVFSYVSTGYFGLIREKVGLGQLLESARAFTRKPNPTPRTTQSTD